MVSSETYKAIQNWIGRQQEYEATHSEPAPLTDAQRKLLDKLESILPPETLSPPEPELEDSNWIGVLLEYRAARQRVNPGVPGGDFLEEAGPVVGLEQKWFCRVRIDEHPDPFPGPHGGLINRMQPAFGRKKDAKKYAAKCAVEWLRANGYMAKINNNNYNGMNPPRTQQTQQPQAQKQHTTPQPSPAKKKPRLSPPSPKKTGASSVETESNKPQAVFGSPLPKGIASPFNDEEVSAVQEAMRLCTRLGHKGLPEFVITKNKYMNDFFDGYPDLGLLAMRLPKDVGRVEKVYGKKATREKIAEELVVHLRPLAAKDDEDDREFMAGQTPSKKDEILIQI
ncbi:hypothetical protein F4804DRAFT_216451 [Jackrogersella minutella]|nr:hypothetical protein F4804DRAFT_216451 [Jackrogersella minutella]